MMNELRQAAKDSLGTFSLWLDDEQYDAIINAVLAKAVDLEHNTSGDWMQTYTGKRFYPLRPDPELVCIEDIAHSLSLKCRYGGHCCFLFSVAEHSVLMADAVLSAGGSPMEALMALMHDSPEAYVDDMIRPIKKSVIGYEQIETRVWEAICTKFDFDPNLPPIIKEFDNRILADEKAQNMAALDWDYTPGPPLGVKLMFWNPIVAEEQFLRRFYTLTNQITA
jgi:uncharacterized protein